MFPPMYFTIDPQVWCTKKKIFLVLDPTSRLSFYPTFFQIRPHIFFVCVSSKTVNEHFKNKQNKTKTSRYSEIKKAFITYIQSLISEEECSKNIWNPYTALV